MINISKEERSRNLRYKKPALMELSYSAIQDKLYEIMEICGDIYWTNEDDIKLLNAFDGDEDQVMEIKNVFVTLKTEAEELSGNMYNTFHFWDEDEIENDMERAFNDLTVALIGNRYQVIGYDDYQEDYYSLTTMESDIAVTEAGKRLMRLTKADLIARIGQALGIILAFQNVQMKYEYLKSTIDLLTDRNEAMYNQMRAINLAYEKAEKEGFFYNGYEKKGTLVRQFENLVKELPDRVWVE